MRDAGSSSRNGGVLLYDPDCGFCTATAHRMRALRLGAAVQALTPARCRGAGIDPERATREIPFADADGRVCFGARAIGRALATGPLPVRMVGLLVGHRPVLWIAQPAYVWVAGHRHQLPGGTAACRIDDRPA